MQRVSILKEVNFTASSSTTPIRRKRNKDELIKELKGVLIVILGDWWPLVEDRTCRQTVRAQGNMVRDIVNTDAYDGWIPCSKDNMPREHEDVLVLYKGKRRIAELDWDIGQANANFEPYQYWGNPDRPGEEELEWEHVTHWQYLPPAIELQ